MSVDWHSVFTDFPLNKGTLALDGLLALLLFGYVGGARLLARRHRRWPARRLGCFAAGLLLLFVALGSGVAVYDDDVPSAHVIQHMLLMMAAPVLIVLGRPLLLLAQAGPRWLQRRVNRLQHRRLFGALVGPVGIVSYYALMPLYFLTPLYAASVRSDLLHEALHAVLFTIGLAYAAALLGLDGPARLRPSFARLVTLVAGMPVEAALGFALMLWPRPLVAGTTLAATHRGGQVFLMTSMLASGLLLLILVAQWIGADERRVRRLEAQVSAAAFEQSTAPVLPE